MPVSIRARGRLPEAIRSLQPPNELQLEVARILEAGRIERQQHAMAARRRIEDAADDRIKLVG